MGRVDWHRQDRVGCRLKKAPLREMNSTQFHTLREAQLIKLKTTKHAVAHVNLNWGLFNRKLDHYFLNRQKGLTLSNTLLKACFTP